MADEKIPKTDDAAATDEAPAPDDPKAAPPGFHDLADERLRANWDKLDKEYQKKREAAKTPEQIEELRSIRMQQAEIAKEMSSRKERADELQQQMADLDATDVALPDLGEQQQPDADQLTTGDAPAAEGQQSLPVAAGAAPTAAQVAAARDPQSAAAKTAAGQVSTHARKPWLAAASVASGDVSMGAPIDLSELGESIMRFGKWSTPHKTILASLPAFTEHDGELLSDDNGARTNTRLINEAVAAWEIRHGLRTATPNAMTAAICDPLDIIREIPNPGRSQATPFSDSLPFRGAGRLGFQFIHAMTILTMAGGASFWSTAQQASVDEGDPGTWKAVVDVNCPMVASTRADELTWGMRYEESTELSNPEVVADALNALMTLEKRVREGYLLRRFDMLSSGASWDTPSIGAIPEVIEALYRRIEACLYTERLELPGLTVWLPPGFLAALTVDRARRAYGIDRTAGEVLAQIKAELPNEISWVELRDISDNGDGDADIPPETVGYGAGETLAAPLAARTALGHGACGDFRVRFGWPRSFLAYSTGMTNFGVLRDANLIRQNKTIQFGREWLGLDKHGAEGSGYIDFTLSVSGIRGANLTTTSTDTIACSSTTTLGD